MTASQQLAQVLADIGRRDVEHADAIARLRAEAVRLNTLAAAEALQAERQRREAAERGLVEATKTEGT